MTTQASGLAAYILRIGAATDGSVPRAFGNLNREARESRRRVAELDEQQRELTRQLRRTSRGTEEYRRLEAQIREARDEARGLTQALDAQRQRWTALGTAARRFRNVAGVSIGGLAGIATGAAIGIDRFGESLARANTVALQLDFPIEDLQRIERLSRIQGFDFDPQDLIEFNTRLGEIRDGLQRGEPALQGTVNAFEALGLDIRTVSVRDLPLIIRRLRELETLAERQFFADELFSGTGAETYVLALTTATDDLYESVQRSSVASREQAEALIRSRQQITFARDAAAGLTREFLSALAPAITSAAEAAAPLTTGLAQFVSENQGLVQGAGATVAAIGGLATAIWGVNAALAAYRALQGPAGWAILGASAALLAAGAITVGVFIRRGQAEQERRSRLEDIAARDRNAMLGQAVDRASAAGTEAGAYAGVTDALAPQAEPAAPSPADNARLAAIAARNTGDLTAAIAAAEQRVQDVRIEGFGRPFGGGDLDRAQQRVDDRIALLEAVLADTSASEAERAGALRNLNTDSSIFRGEGLYAARDRLARIRRQAFNRGAAFPNLAQQALALEADASYQPYIGPDPPNVAPGATPPQLPPPVRAPVATPPRVVNNNSYTFNSVADPAGIAAQLASLDASRSNAVGNQ